MKSNNCIIRTALAAAVLSICGGLLPAHAQVSVNINIAPPQPQYEVVPTLRSGYAWAPGYWAWQGRDYQWVRGHQIAQRPGYRWVADHWEAGNRYRAGYWEPEHRRKGRDKHDRRDRDEGDDEGHHHGNGHKGDSNFCPPGQAKKGNC
ncbi:MAG: YXWGXW repeat-containing protein [Herminiimonas sp.]|nr:YXWGXW repeat-containing protein [Herminiimonas sp.]